MTARSEAYPQTLFTHLGRYRCDCLGIKEPGIFLHKGRELPKDHILLREDWQKNFLPLIRDPIRNLMDVNGDPIKWHRFAHHLNSSQVMAVNLFLPLMASEERLAMLGKVTGVVTPVAKDTGFELIPDEVEKTNIDVVIGGSGGERLFIEVKLTEADFGRAADDGSHREKFERIYKKRCVGRILLSPGKEWAEFRQNYQFFRNALFAEEKTRVWFLIPSPHASLIRRAEACMKLLDDRIRPKVSLVHLGTILDKIEGQVGGNPDLVEHYRQFRRKYQPALVK